MISASSYLISLKVEPLPQLSYNLSGSPLITIQLSHTLVSVRTLSPFSFSAWGHFFVFLYDFCGSFSSNSLAICGYTMMFSPPLWLFFPSLQRLMSADVGEGGAVTIAAWGLCFWCPGHVCAVCSRLESAAFPPECSTARIHLWFLLFDLSPHWDNWGVLMVWCQWNGEGFGLWNAEEALQHL